ncbi:ribosomal RNA-processing protein 8 [Hippoglossus hippoglossus]|uniref:ribosomal RNA-processing protein 8 n=1 Tax=Hippoglossus hippoglossus TaxID=8267 RepID=UPI00148D788E|nr:ribosomal RNA-processing protein 8 [Hippoglossus hippoglossus]
MFNEEEDWSDDQDAQTQSKTVSKGKEKVNNGTHVKSKLVGKKSLLRTLETLGSIPKWKNTDHQQDSDSEGAAEASSSPTKRKKKRRKKRRHAKTSEEPQENGDLDPSVEEEKPAAKKKSKFNKVVAKKIKTTSAGETKDKEMTKSAKTNIDNPDDTEKLSRQQWRNKMKNKKKCKNKFREKEEENETESADKHKQKEEVKTDSSISKNSKTSTVGPKKKSETERKPQKRKQPDEDTGVSCAPEILKGGKQQTEKQTKTKGGYEHAKITDDLQPSPNKRLKPELSKEQILKRAKLRKMLQIKEPVQPDQPESPAEPKDEPAAPEEEVKLDRSASLRLRMEQRLESARFRYINEVLYSTSSGDAKRMFKQDPQAFWIYHRGYTTQVKRWPANPVDAIISWIQLKPPAMVVADFGCGDCKIARSVQNKVHSFDLAAACELVTVCDMANVPLRDFSVDIAVFCLSLMGTNLADFLSEANRVLKMGGVLKIAEVASRFDNVRSFLTALANMGFRMVSKDTENTHFYSFECVKSGNAPENVKKFGLQLNPCLYKKR